MANGVITGYRIYVNFNNGSRIVSTEIGTRSSSYNIVNLHPHQNITISMSAKTAVGEGPNSLGINVITVGQETDQESTTTSAPENIKTNNQNDNSFSIIAGVVPLALVICVVLVVIFAVCGWRKIKRCSMQPNKLL